MPGTATGGFAVGPRYPAEYEPNLSSFLFGKSQALDPAVQNSNTIIRITITLNNIPSITTAQRAYVWFYFWVSTSASGSLRCYQKSLLVKYKDNTIGSGVSVTTGQFIFEWPNNTTFFLRSLYEVCFGNPDDGQDFSVISAEVSDPTVKTDTLNVTDPYITFTPPQPLLSDGVVSGN